MVTKITPTLQAHLVRLQSSLSSLGQLKNRHEEDRVQARGLIRELEYKLWMSQQSIQEEEKEQEEKVDISVVIMGQPNTPELAEFFRSTIM